MNSYNILFLDIDGVCNHCERDEDLYFDAFNNTNIPLCNDNVSNLKNLIDSVNDLKIVWSTDWRMCNDQMWNQWKNPRLVLESYNWIKDRLLGATPKKFSSTHPEEIRMWFNSNKRDFIIHNYVVLDDWDSPAMHDWFGPHFIQCNPKDGLTSKNVANAINLFNNELDNLDFNYDR